MKRSRALAAVAVTAALLTTSCVAPESGGSPLLETAGASSLAPLPSATPAPTTTTTTTTTTTLGLPEPPELGDGATVCDLYAPEVDELGVVASGTIVEASGIAASRTNADAYWVVNDSGNGTILHAVGQDGSELAAIDLDGVLGFDWEDIAVGPGPEPGASYIYVGDIGDNLHLRNTISLLRFPEPDLSEPPAALNEVETIRLSYPDKPEDSEAMWVDPITGDVFVVTKRQSDGRAVVFRTAAADLDLDEPAAMTAIAEFTYPDNVFVTAADVTTDGAVLAMRGYNQVWMWVRRDLTYEETLAADPCLAPSPDEIQGEAITFIPGSLAYVTLSEGSAKPLNLVSPLP